MANNQDIISGITSALNEYGEILTSQIKSNIKQKNKIASGRLYESVNFKVTTNGSIISLEILAEDYLQWVDEGRKPGKQPPLEPILKWVNEKRFKKVGKAKAKKLSETSPTQIAWAIATKIKKVGIKPSKVLSSAVKSTNKSFKNELTKRVAAGLEVEISLQLKQAINQIK